LGLGRIQVFSLDSACSIRFGSFEIFKPIDSVTQRSGPSVGMHHILSQLADYVIQTFYPHISSKYNHEANKENKYLDFFEEVVHRTACLVAEWQCVGWCHGVLNTDNMSIVGVTIDYGPFGFMDRYDPNHICNGSGKSCVAYWQIQSKSYVKPKLVFQLLVDSGGRYSYKNQPGICRWNCLKLAEALSPIVSLQKCKKALEKFDDIYQIHYLNKMRRKVIFQMVKTNILVDIYFACFFVSSLAYLKNSIRTSWLS
jgi:uncharacterized protein YdiU (UPF0061 family)